MLPFPSFEEAVIQTKTLNKGQSLFERNPSPRIDVLPNHTWHVYYPSRDPSNPSSSEYKIVVQIQEGWVSYSFCTCPSLRGPFCEHLIAALFHIRQHDSWISQRFEAENTETQPIRNRTRERNSRVSGRNRSDTQNPQTNEVDGDVEVEEEEEEDEDIESGTENSWNRTSTQRELECQICLDVVKKPVLLGCQCHSVCMDCLTLLFKHKKRTKNGYKEIFCPTCGEKSGSLKIKKIENLKVNQELLRMKKAYQGAKDSWEQEKIRLEIEIADMKAKKEKEEQEAIEKEQKNNDQEPSNNDKNLQQLSDINGIQKETDLNLENNHSTGRVAEEDIHMIEKEPIDESKRLQISNENNKKKNLKRKSLSSINNMQDENEEDAVYKRDLKKLKQANI